MSARKNPAHGEGRGNSDTIKKESTSQVTASTGENTSANIPRDATSWAGVPLEALHPLLRYGDKAYMRRVTVLMDAVEADRPVAEVVAEYNAEFTRAAADKQRHLELESAAAGDATGSPAGPSSDGKGKAADAKKEEAKALKDFRVRRSSRERPRPRLVPLVADLIDAGTLFFIAGKPGEGKSHIVADLGCSVATGRDFARRKVQRGPVVFLVGEGELSFSDRVRAWERLRNDGHTIDYADLMILPGAEDLRDPTSPIARAMVQAVTEVNPSLVFLDTLNRYTAGADENASKEMGSFLKVAANIQAGPSNPAVGIVHHTTKSTDELRGSSAINGAADTVLLSKHAKPGLFKVDQVKQRNREDGIPFAEFTLEATSWTEEDAEGEPIAVDSVVAVWDERDPEREEADEKAKPRRFTHLNDYGLSPAEQVRVIAYVLGGEEFTETLIRNLWQDMTGRPRKTDTDEWVSAWSTAKRCKAVTNIRKENGGGTRQFYALSGHTWDDKAHVSQALADLTHYRDSGPAREVDMSAAASSDEDPET